MNTSAYLERIKYNGPVAPTAETLRALQLAHLRAVPFENLSIHAGQRIVLNDEALFTKIVENRRGGFCYEANGLFAALLRELGFDVAMLAGEVADAEGEFGPEFDHMTLMVTLAERWLVDVGFGDSFLEPLRLDDRSDQVQGSRAYQMVSDDTHFTLLQRDDEGAWKAQYRFMLEPHSYDDYEEMCRYHQTSPNSHFTRSRICSLATEDGRISLSEMRLITTTNSRTGQIRDERTLKDEAEYAETLRERFGIVIKT